MSRLPHRSPMEVQKQLEKNAEEDKLWDAFKNALGLVGTLICSDTATESDIAAAQKRVEEAKAKLETFIGKKVF
jgi:hypothetical protein